MNIGVIVIGRNEGERLRVCIESVVNVTDRVVYVDSGSADGSVQMVQGMGLAVVELDMRIPFTAARARNEGVRLLHKLWPSLNYVQFVDGDCELASGWMKTAAAFLDLNNKVAMVCGRLRERHPEHSVYNMLCDTEWDTAVGETKACGGNAMARIEVFDTAGGFRPDLIAGEESELCLRLRASGWTIWRLDAEMALHDAAMTRFSQWWKRSMRGGYAYAEGVHLHGASPEKHRVQESRRIWLWGVWIPLAMTILIGWVGAWGWMMFLIYPIQIIRIALRGSRSVRENWLRALFLVLGKFPEAMGQIKFFYNRLSRKTSHLIEYK